MAEVIRVIKVTPVDGNCTWNNNNIGLLSLKVKRTEEPGGFKVRCSCRTIVGKAMFVMADYRIVQYCNRTTDKKSTTESKIRLKHTRLLRTATI